MTNGVPTPEQPSSPHETDSLGVWEKRFLELANSAINNDPVSEDTKVYQDNGGNIRLCLREIEKESQTEASLELAQARDSYLAQAMNRTSLLSLLGFGKAARKKEADQLREGYVKAVIGQVEKVVEAKTPQQALEARQLPAIARKTNFKDEEPPTIEDFSANHLYVLADTALREHAARRNIIANRNSNNPVRRFLGNRALRMSAVGTVFVASAYPDLHFVHINNPEAAEITQYGLEIISAAIFAYEAPDEIRWRYLDIIHARSTKKMHGQLASDQQLSDLALRIAYNASRYHDKLDHTQSGTLASPNKQENLKRFAELDKDFKYFNNDPGEKPYNGNEVLGYAARLLIERHNQIDGILAESQSAEDQEKAYLELTRDIVEEDLKRMEKGLSASRIRQAFWRLIGVIPSVLFPGAVSATGNAVGLGQDVANVGKAEDEPSGA